MVLGERGVIGSPWGGPSLIEMVLTWAWSLKNHLVSARSFISASPTCSRPWQPYNNNNSNDWENEILCLPLQLSYCMGYLPLGKGLFCEFPPIYEKSTKSFSFPGRKFNPIEQTFIDLLSTYYVRGCPPC